MICGGTGLVCPVCRGVRFTRRNVPVGHPDFGKALRCTSCCEGNNVHPEHETRAIQAYLRTYTPRPPEQLRAEAVAVMASAQAEYRSLNGDPRTSLRKQDADGAAARRGNGWRRRGRERAARGDGAGLLHLGAILQQTNRSERSERPRRAGGGGGEA